jgi:DhnA family fructose-bisphosphate aldolase class Ia
VPREYGNVYGNGNAKVVLNALAMLGVALAAGAIGFAYGRIFDHESRISGLEAIQRYIMQEQRQHGGP